MHYNREAAGRRILLAAPLKIYLPKCYICGFLWFPTVEVQVFEERVDLSNDMTWRQMIGVGVRNVVLARGELDRLEGPGYAARRTELRRKAKEAARTRDRQAAASQDEAEENDATEEEMTRERTTRVGRPRGGMKVAARSGERLRREIGRGRLPRVGDG